MYSDYSEVIVVGAGADAVEYKLISICHKGDVVVSQDYGVAAMALGKGITRTDGKVKRRCSKWDYIGLDCYFLINAGMLSNSERIRLIPREKILVESDGPYSKIDGKKYQPSYLLREYELIAKALKEPDLIKLVYSNFKTLLTL